MARRRIEREARLAAERQRVEQEDQARERARRLKLDIAVRYLATLL
jgi:hypothetical protein